jgi:ubiquinone/menaquinone biosynthesis C-methylase UbiE
MSFVEINKRYSELAQSDSSLSCGGAVNFAQAEPGEVCVDLGSGRGTDVIRLAGEVGSNGFVYGIDISDGMIRKSFNSAEQLGVTNVDFIKCSLENIRLGNSMADLVISNCSINHAANKQAVWNEVYRILKKGGRFVVSDIYATTPIPDEYHNDPVAVAECWAGAVTRGEYLRILYEAGFVSVRIFEESAPYIKGQATIVSFTISGEKPGESKACRCRV